MILEIAGALDPHVHLRDLDWAHKATFASETAAALAGGYWAIFDMPNTPPATITRSALDIKLRRMQETALCDWGIYFGASQHGNEREYPAIIDDVCGLKIYNNATTGDLLIADQQVREAHYRAWAATNPRKPIAVHAEEQTVADILALVRQYRVFTHFCHISTREEIALLRTAKAEGLPISVGVTPHHLYLTQDDLGTLGSLGLMKPELKTAADRASLWEAIADGTVDVVESDHAPHTLAEKQSSKPPFGVPGLETTIPLLGLAVHEGRITAERLVELVALNPQHIFGVQPPAGTITRLDLSASYVIERSKLHTAPRWSPFEGIRVFGRVREVRIGGNVVFDGENVRAVSGSGRRAI
ncbi:MAG: dihydroorotase family protein [Anaerolineae bacterium]